MDNEILSKDLNERLKKGFVSSSQTVYIDNESLRKGSVGSVTCSETCQIPRMEFLSKYLVTASHEETCDNYFIVKCLLKSVLESLLTSFLLDQAFLILCNTNVVQTGRAKNCQYFSYLFK